VADRLELGYAIDARDLGVKYGRENENLEIEEIRGRQTNLDQQDAI
jgi:hypothetical protein